MSFTNDFKDSNATWRQFKEQLLTHMRGNDLIDIESQDNALSDMFDQYSGVDAIHLATRKGVKLMRGVAIRCQWGKSWDTFTIRFHRSSGAKTEYVKRCEAIFGKGGFWYPYLTVQLYAEKRFGDTRILSCGIIKTKSLYEYTKENIDTIRRITTREDGNIFLAPSFRELKEHTSDFIQFSDNRPVQKTSLTLRREPPTPKPQMSLGI